MNYEEKAALYNHVVQSMSDPEAASIITQAMTDGQRELIARLRQQNADTETLAVMIMAKKGLFSSEILLDQVKHVAKTGHFNWESTVDALENKIEQEKQKLKPS